MHFKNGTFGVLTMGSTLAEEDKVVSLFTMEGTYKNKHVKFRGTLICRIVDGKDTEVWEVFDRFAIFSQLATGLGKVMIRLIEKEASKDQP